MSASNIAPHLRRSSGFTLVEIMIVVAIIALLVSIAVPSFIRARERSQVVRFINDLRVFADSAQNYATETNAWPPDGLENLPPELLPFVKEGFDPGRTPLGGKWDWDYESVSGYTALASALEVPAAAEKQMLAVDVEIDDGNLSTGTFRKLSDRYALILQE